MNRNMLILLIIFMAFSSIFAVDIEIGEGTITSHELPANGFFAYNWSNFIITSDLIGITAEFNQIKVHPSNNPSNFTFTGQKIYFKETTNTTVSGDYPNPEANGFTLVYEGNITFTGNNFQGVMLDTPFDYDGTSNLQIVWENRTGQWAGGYPEFYQTEIGTNIAAHNEFDSSFPTGSGTVVTHFPNLVLSYAAENEPTAVSLIAPANNALNVSTTTNLQWALGSNTTDVDVYLSTSANDVTSLNANSLVVDAENVTSYNAIDLQENTTYFWRVVSRNSANNLTVNGSIWQFTTVFSENIESIAIGNGTTGSFRQPWNFWYYSSIAETIYLRDEINFGGQLTTISFFNSFETNVGLKPVEIWVGETDQPNLAEYIPASQLTAVYSGLVDFPAGQNTITITLDTPYDYTGGNLVLLTKRPLEEGGYTPSDQFLVTGTNLASRTLYWQSADVDYDPDNMLGAPGRLGDMTNVVFHFSTSGLGSVTGNITTGTGALAGVNISIDDTFAITTSSADGSFAFPHIVAGDYTLTATKLGYQDLTYSFSVVESEETTLDLQMELLDNVVVSGQVITNEGNMGVQAHVTLTGYLNYAVDTDANGFFSIPGVVANHTYVGKALADNYQAGYFTVVVEENDLDIGTTFVSEILYPANEVVAQIEGDNVVVTWTAPDGTGDGGWLTKSSEDNYDGIGTGEQAIIDAAHMYTEDELLDYQGMYINSIKFFPREAAATYTIKIWGGEDGNTLLYSQAVTNFTSQAWNEFELDSSVAIPTTGPIYIGYSVNTPFGHPLGCDSGPNIPGGDMIKLNNQLEWDVLHDIDYMSINWNIQALVAWTSGDQIASTNRSLIMKKETQQFNNSAKLVRGNLEPIAYANNPTRVFEEYNIYRFLIEDETDMNSWELIGEGITALTFSDTEWSNQSAGYYKYAVKAVYTNAIEAAPVISNWLQNSIISQVTVTVDSNIDQVVPNANILLIAQDTNPDGELAEYSAISDDSGIAVIPVSAGMYDFSVTATGFTSYAGVIDASTHVSATALLNEIAFSVVDINATIEENNAVITWGAPDGTDAGEWLTKGGDTSNNAVGSGGQGPLTVAHMFTEEELVDYQGMYINSIKFFPREGFANYLVRIWGGDEGSIELYSQVASGFTPNAWSEHQLTSTMVVPTSGPLYFGYTANTPFGNPCGCDSGPVIPGGNLLKLGNNTNWSLLTDVSELEANWNIKALVSWARGDEDATQRVTLEKQAEPIAKTTDDTRDLLGYNVYRFLIEDEENLEDWDIIAESLTALTYTDIEWSTLDSGYYKYAVRAVYTNNVLAKAEISNWLQNVGLITVTVNVTSNLDDIIAEANVLLTSQTLNPDGVYDSYQGVTDASGTAIIEVGVGMFDLTVSAPGYVLYSSEVDVTEDVTINVVMNELAVPPSAVVAQQEGVDALITWGIPVPGGEATTESFEESFPPAGWSTIVTNQNQSWARYESVMFETGPVPPTDGSYQVGVMWDYGHQDEWLISREMRCPAGDLVFDFYGHQGSPNGDNYFVKITTDDGETWDVLWNASDLPESDNHYDTPIVIDLNDYTGQDVKIAWNNVDGDGQGLWYATYIDNIYFGGTRLATRDLLAVSKADNQLTRSGNSNASRIRIKRDANEPINRVATTTQETKIANSPSRSSNRALEGYKVWRLLATDQGNEANWISLTPNMITDLTYTDTAWDGLTPGSYKFAVKAIYTNENVSNAAFSNLLLKDMYGTVSGTVMNESNEPINGATLHLNGDTATTDATGFFLLTDVLAGDYDITATATDYVAATQSITVVATQMTTVDFTLVASNVLISDSFETYPNFALQADPWVFHDGDEAVTYGITDVEFANSGDPMAYIIFNPFATVPPLPADYGGHTGDKFAACFASINTPNNDWMMTEEFTVGTEGLFSFWARSLTSQYGFEQFNVLISTGSTNPNDFTVISGATPVQAPVVWNQFSYSLNDYVNQTIRVAIQCVSNDVFMFMVDDVQIDSPGGTDNDDTLVPVVKTTLHANYPNPFNPETTISYSVEKAGNVTIEVYNMLGQKVKTLVNDAQTVGSHTVVWNGTDKNGKSVSSGVYFYRMKNGTYSKTNKMILMK